MKLIEWVAEKIGWETTYHICCKEHVDGSHTSTGTGIYGVLPWITPENYRAVKKIVAERHGFNDESTVIISITKI